MRNITHEIKWKTGAVSGKITPARSMTGLTGMAGNCDRREHKNPLAPDACTSHLRGTVFRYSCLVVAFYSYLEIL